MSGLLWAPSPEQVARANVTRFIARANREHALELKGFDDLYAWSVREIPAFWETMWTFAELRASAPHEAVLENPVMPGARWFRGAELNFAENLLRYRDGRTALVFMGERGTPERVSYAELYGMVARLARFLVGAGVGCGIGWRGSCPTGSRPSWPCLRPRASARSGLPAARTSASKG